MAFPFIPPIWEWRVLKGMDFYPGGKKKKPFFVSSKKGFAKIQAAFYSPIPLPGQYHRRWRA